MQWTVRPYTPADEAEWDRFVMHESGNGTFLQTRNFLNYHPAGRFTDASLMVYNEHGGLGAVVPAALRRSDFGSVDAVVISHHAMALAAVDAAGSRPTRR